MENKIIRLQNFLEKNLNKPLLYHYEKYEKLNFIDVENYDVCSNVRSFIGKYDKYWFKDGKKIDVRLKLYFLKKQELPHFSGKLTEIYFASDYSSVLLYLDLFDYKYDKAEVFLTTDKDYIRKYYYDKKIELPVKFCHAVIRYPQYEKQ